MGSQEPTSLISAIHSLKIKYFLPSVYLGGGVDVERNGEQFDLFGYISPKDLEVAISRKKPLPLAPKSYYRIYRKTGEIELTHGTWSTDTVYPIICRPFNYYHGQFRLHVVNPGKIDVEKFLNYLDFITKPQVFALSPLVPKDIRDKFRIMREMKMCENVKC